MYEQLHFGQCDMQAKQSRLAQKQISYFWQIIGLSIAVFIASLDTAISNTALPNISQDLNASFIKAIWVINSYQLVMVAFILPIAAFADRYSYKKIFLIGISVFVFASWCCAESQSLYQLIAARVLQGLAAAAILGTNIALVRKMYSPEKLGLGLGINAFVIAGGLASGPVIASLILNIADWNWLFLINIPLGILAFIFCLKLPVSIKNTAQAYNFVSAVLCICMFSALIFGLGEIANSTDFYISGMALVFASICAALLIYRDQHHPQPIFPIDLFQQPIFSLSVFTAFLAFVAQGLVLLALPYLLYQMSFSQIKIGLLIAPWATMGACMAPIAGLLSNKISSAILGAVGLSILCLGILLLAFSVTTHTQIEIAISMLICGFGFGLFLTPNQRMLMANSPMNRSGAAGGTLNVFRTLGQAVGAALVALILKFSQGETVVLLGVAALFAALGAVTSFIRLLK